MDNKINVKDMTEQEYFDHYMEIIHDELKAAFPIMADNFVKLRMKHYGITGRYLPPTFRGRATAVETPTEPQNDSDA